MEIYLTNAALAGFGYALAALFSKRALQEGCGILRFSFVCNLVFVGVFAIPYLGGGVTFPAAGLHLPVIAGVFFFGGQVFTFAAIRMGDVSLQTPMMGMKAVFVVLLAVVLGTEPIDGAMWSAAFLAMSAVLLLGLSGGGAKRVGLTLTLAMLSALFFAGADTMVGTFGRDFGPRNFIFITMLVNGLLSFGLIPFFKEPLNTIPRAAWLWTALGAVGMGAQALLLNYTLAAHQNVAAVNILYSSRGLWSVVLAIPLAYLFSMPREAVTRQILIQRFIGALFMSFAVALVLTR